MGSFDIEAKERLAEMHGQLPLLCIFFVQYSFSYKYLTYKYTSMNSAALSLEMERE